MLIIWKLTNLIFLSLVLNFILANWLIVYLSGDPETMIAAGMVGLAIIYSLPLVYIFSFIFSKIISSYLDLTKINYWYKVGAFVFVAFLLSAVQMPVLNLMFVVVWNALAFLGIVY